MTPNPNPSPELRERLQTRLTAHLSGDRRNDRNWPLVIDASELAEIVAALTPPTPAETVTVALPGAGELAGHVRGIAQVIRAFPNDEAWGGPDMARQAAAILDRAVEALATVAAANEGVARIIDPEAFEFVPDTLEIASRQGRRARALAKAAAIRLLSQGAGKAERYRHVKRGTVYEVVGRASLQNANQAMLAEAACLVIYHGDDGNLWAREESEFNDGRFEPLATSRSQHEGAGR